MMNSFRPHTAAIAAAVIIALASRAAARTEIANATQPQLAAGANDRVFVVYGQRNESPSSSDHGDHAAHGAAHGGEKKKKVGHGPAASSGAVVVAVSTDGGTTFSHGIKVASLPKLMLGNRRGPRIAVHGDRLTVTAIAHELVAFTSTDGGKTWSEATTINDVPDSAHEGLHDLAVSSDGDLFVTWLDLRNGKTELWGAGSKDGGRSWTNDEVVYKSPDKSVCECCHPSALFDSEGNLAVMWRNSIVGSRDMWLTTRARGAAQFTPARKLGEGTWKINGCPHDGGSIVALGGGKFGAVWQREGQVYLLRADGPEIALGKGRQPAAASTENGPLVVWNDGTQLIASGEPSSAQPQAKFSEGRFPSLAALPGGKGAVVAYEVGAKGIAVERL